ncbi:hypothetical protein K435DRAFT_778153 [Dendrothele bispora CBS 962.96]|uniref:ER membrane protein complex subunit 6 n=1 Tax=Dendrothele bispora (strain CBS 962.96) TaxID=1314807 RepID=A0A4S8M4Z0_DENBC|nr:hypothetical protein K435DRAFT_778153 [Dendrothele bispora CBS 962.96]
MSSSSPSADAKAQLIFAPNAAHNTLSLTTIKFFSACFAGAVAGILGLQNLSGFALFVFSTAFTSFTIWSINCGAKPVKYVPGGWKSMVNPGTDNAFTFVLVWTLFYGIVHVYD